jgi:hypothetical protein
MENNEISVNGNFAVRVGKMWATKDYNSINLDDQPNSLYSFKKAYELADKVGGRVVIFKPTELSDEQLAELKLAAADGNDD